MTEYTIVKALEKLLNQGVAPIRKKKSVIADKLLIQSTLDLIREKNKQIEALTMENADLKCNLTIISNDYEHIKKMWEHDKKKTTEIINNRIIRRKVTK